jgi:hypothetical protein
MRACATEEFPDTGLKFPDLLDIFPVNLRRELLEAAAPQRFLAP